MTHTLITILGGSRGPGYRQATYRFSNGEEDRTTFFGLALARHLHPEVTVILGTAGSQWGVLVEHLAGETSDEEDARLELLSAEEQGTVTQELLDRLAPLMARRMNCEVRPALIPLGRDEQEQYHILSAIADAVPKGSLSFDLTHGFRHLGMVGFLSSFMLERLHRLEVRGLWYGALDMTRGDITPVLRLDGLMGVQRWVAALDRFDATGDYAVFGPLLVADGVAEDKAACLEGAAFLERTLNVEDAAEKIRTFLPVLDCPLNGTSRLFQDQLATRLRWVQENRRSEQLRKLARQYLSRGDFVRAAMFGREACDKHVREELDLPIDERPSDETQEAIQRFVDELTSERRHAFHTLRQYRNALAHGERPESTRMQAALKNPQELRRELERALKTFFGSHQRSAGSLRLALEAVLDAPQ